MVRFDDHDLKSQRRRSIRLKGYDYSLAGAYFTTIATYQKTCFFGEVVNGDVTLNQYGNIAYEQWIQLSKRFMRCNFSVFIVMPNHIHGIIHILNSAVGKGAGEAPRDAVGQIPPLRPYAIPRITSGSLGAIMRAYKASVTYRINAIRGFTEPPVWQRNYFEHIIRNDKEYLDICNYIETNPLNWENDRLHMAQE